MILAVIVFFFAISLPVFYPGPRAMCTFAFVNLIEYAYRTLRLPAYLIPSHFVISQNLTLQLKYSHLHTDFFVPKTAEKKHTIYFECSKKERRSLLTRNFNSRLVRYDSHRIKTNTICPMDHYNLNAPPERFHWPLSVAVLSFVPATKVFRVTQPTYKGCWQWPSENVTKPVILLSNRWNTTKMLLHC